MWRTPPAVVTRKFWTEETVLHQGPAVKTPHLDGVLRGLVIVWDHLGGHNQNVETQTCWEPELSLWSANYQSLSCNNISWQGWHQTEGCQDLLCHSSVLSGPNPNVTIFSPRPNRASKNVVTTNTWDDVMLSYFLWKFPLITSWMILEAILQDIMMMSRTTLSSLSTEQSSHLPRLLCNKPVPCVISLTGKHGLSLSYFPNRN